MENILKCRFMRTLLRGQKHDYDPNYLLSSYQEFKKLLLSTSDGDQYYREKFRTMQNLHRLLELHISTEKFIIGHGENIKQFAYMAIALVSVEVDLRDKQLQYPSLFTLTEKVTNSKKPSEFHWNLEKFTKRDLIELITALEANGAIIDNDGNSISFTRLIEYFAASFSVAIPSKYAYKERDYILNIKRRSPSFIDFIASSLLKNNAKNHR